MEWKSDSVFPNGKSKSFLLEAFFHHYDFGCTPNQYLEEIEFSKLQERNNEKNCHWIEDIDSKLVVTGLNIENPYTRIEIIKDGFRKIGTVTRKSIAARENQIKQGDDVKELFTPGRAIDDPLKFVGRYEHVRRIAETDLTHGRLFLISGERSTGKTSLARLLFSLFNGNMDVVDYYDLSLNSDFLNKCHSIFIDISSGISNTEQLAYSILSKLSPSKKSQTSITKKITLSAAGLAKYEQSYNLDIDKKSIIQNLSELFQLLQQENKKVVVVIDEFDLFEDSESFAKILRYWSSHGLVCFILGTGEKFKHLLSGHLSLARNAVPLTLSVLPEKEFKEIFYLAGTIAESIIKFDEGAINLLYKYSGDLPYFGQLFGYILVDILLANSLKEETHLADRENHVVYESDVNYMLELLKHYCSQFEEEALLLEENIPNGRLGLSNLAHGKSICSNTTETSMNNISWKENDVLLKSLIDVVDGKLAIIDPVLRQYVILTRCNA